LESFLRQGRTLSSRNSLSLIVASFSLLVEPRLETFIRSLVLEMEIETTDVIICGCGPTGAMHSGYLGRRSVNNIVLEKELEITQDPRGIALDEDGIRFLQGLGICDKIFTEIGQKMGYFNFISGGSLHVKPFLRFNYNTIEGGTCHPGFMCHKQPVLERCIRDVIY
jgi:2-polyprenyl-6-methoxyphenol hydroxylase-like FAD-dependent oxidoreductase